MANRRGFRAAAGQQGQETALGDAQRAIGFFEQALAIDREIGNRWAEGLAVSNLGLINLNQGRYEDEVTDADLAKDADGNPIIPQAFYSPSGRLVSRPAAAVPQMPTLWATWMGLAPV